MRQQITDQNLPQKNYSKARLSRSGLKAKNATLKSEESEKELRNGQEAA